MRTILRIATAAGCLLFVAGASAALIKYENLVLTADGSFEPRSLPRRVFAPIDFKGHADLKAVDGGVPSALQQAVIGFDRDGRLSVGGLPACDPSLLVETTPAQARARCPRAIVGTGHVAALITQDNGLPLRAGSLLTVFNGPRQEGRPTAILHARTTAPAVQTFVITVPIEKRRGEFRYRATVDVPPIAAGRGSLAHIDVKIGRRYRFRGSKRSYASARCSDNVLRTHGRFTFAEGLIIDGSVEKACTFR